MHPLSTAVLFAVLLHSDISAADGKKSASKPAAPCTVRSQSSGTLFDLNSLSRTAAKEGLSESWHVKGFDYPSNFTLNFCAPVVEDVKDVVGVDKNLWRNVSAYYELHGKTYSIGQLSSEPVLRGRKLVLNYTDGSPCPSVSQSSRSFATRREASRNKSKTGDDDDDEDDNDDRKKGKNPDKSDGLRRKSTVISLLCDREPTTPKAAVAFVGAVADCVYFFEVRSQYACGGATNPQQTVAPGGVFGIIVLIAIIVYLVGGCVYQRTVMHARGWRQLPNYSAWAGLWNFISDIFLILASSLARLLPLSFFRRGRTNSGSYHPVSSQAFNAHNGRNGSNGNRRNTTTQNDDENRLIDQLDDEWDD